jgi:hypothetical protein
VEKNVLVAGAAFEYFRACWGELLDFVGIQDVGTDFEICMVICLVR